MTAAYKEVLSFLYKQQPMSRLQSVQNAAVRLVSGARRYDRITMVLQELHWFPVRRRMDFKMANLVYLSLFGMAPAYSRRLPFGLRRRSSSAAFCHIKTCALRDEADEPTAWRQVFCRSEAVDCRTAFQLNCDNLSSY